MSKHLLYNPLNVGKVIINNRGQQVKIRKYHLTDIERENLIERHILETKDVPESIKSLAGPYFFNPFRKGIYWGQVQSLYLLGCNKWHNLQIIKDKIKIICQNVNYKSVNSNTNNNLWQKFCDREPRPGVSKSKDIIGRIQENFIFMQRLSCHHPSGYKLRQAFCALDIKKETRIGFSNGLYSYRLSTYSTEEESLPIRDFSNYSLSTYEYKNMKNNFLGTVITSEGIFGIK